MADLTITAANVVAGSTATIARGTASLYAAGGEPVEGYIFVGGEPLSIVVAQGGDTKSGTLYLWIA